MNVHDIIHWSPGVTLEQIERQVIVRAYAYYRSVQATTARALGIDVRTLKAKLARYELDDAAQKKRDDERREAEAAFLARCRGQSPIGQFDHAASKPVPIPQSGINPTGHVPEPFAAEGISKTPMPGESPKKARRA